MRDIFRGDLEISDIWALPNNSQFHVIKYQKHLVRERYPPVALSFSQNLVLFLFFGYEEGNRFL